MAHTNRLLRIVLCFTMWFVLATVIAPGIDIYWHRAVMMVIGIFATYGITFLGGHVNQ